ncbi:DUF4383 domain-containing protein [Mangrovactinospora gilvigrisea]|uniref:DUF4383 domain-containing protein n=1 Tax=Mangrovactinospora gilvigrisea TaxID=1428644 RepID=A0A1J7BBD6_9ACTN|nr:DUF4383 domain-containing protein [Mangrovactinospora gilvigrisea]OIV35917.1 DUF4383 domain-containing protein [Mangrovactinospora gilvigrisea]
MNALVQHQHQHHHRAAELDERYAVDHRLAQVYRWGAGVGGLMLVLFGIAGIVNEVGFFATHGARIAGMTTNGALGALSVLVGVVLMAGAVIGGNTASTVNTVFGVLFVLSGFVGLAVLDTSVNFLAFTMSNVLFSFVFGLVLMVFGMYGRVVGRLPHDNPYWRARHPGHPDAGRSRKMLGSGS